MHRASKKRFEIAEEILLRAEHAAEVVARPGGEGADRRVGHPHDAGSALVEGAVAAAGVDAQRLPVRGLGADFLRGIQRRLRDIDLDFLLRALGKGGHDLRTDEIAPVPAARDGIDDKQMFHLYFAFLSL